MTKSKKWFIAASVAAIFAVNGAVMAAINTQSLQDSKRPSVSDNRNFVHKGAMKKNFKADRQALLDFLKIDGVTLTAELKAGKTMAAIAKERGISEQELKSFIINQRTKRIDEGVKAGRVTSEQADKMKGMFEQRVSDMINGKVPMHRGHHGMFANKEMLTLLKIDAETMKNELKAGKTLAAIANERGVSEQELKDFMVSSIAQRIDKGVESGRISTEKADQMKANLEQRVSDMINGKGPKLGYKHGPRHQQQLRAN